MIKLRVFVSSALDELSEERLAARNAISELFLEPIMFENFGARPEAPRQAYLKEVGRCEIYLGIFGRKYSSATVEECLEAEKNKKDILVYLKDVKREEKLEVFVDYISKRFVYRLFKSPTDLKQAIKEDLTRLMSERYKTYVEVRTEEEAAVKKLEKILEKMNWGLIEPRKGEGYLAVIITPVFLSNSLFKPTKELEQVIHQIPSHILEYSFSEYDPEGYLMEAGRAEKPPLKQLKIYYNGIIHYGEHINYSSTKGIYYDRLAYVFSAISEYGKEILVNLHYEGPIQILLSLYRVKDVPLYKEYAFWGNDYLCKEDKVTIIGKLEGPQEDLTPVVKEILIKLCRNYFGMRIYDKPPSWEVTDKIRSPW